jgi:plasmid maintenance system antidote protein VapI
VRQHSNRDLVSNVAIREAVDRSDLTLTEIARFIGRSERLVRRSLGLAEPQQRISYTLAVDIARAIGVDPVDVDL